VDTSEQRETEGVPGSFADRLNYLIDQYVKHSPEHAHRYPKWPSFEQLAREISERSGRSISHGYLHQLCRGQRDNPTLHHVEALAAFFGVPVTFFTDAGMTAQVIAEYELVTALRDSRIREICLHAPRLDQQGLMAITNLIKNLTAAKDT
jgi:transcriptional regulator with XRE-family HTH domain